MRELDHSKLHSKWLFISIRLRVSPSRCFSVNRAHRFCSFDCPKMKFSMQRDIQRRAFVPQVCAKSNVRALTFNIHKLFISLYPRYSGFIIFPYTYPNVKENSSDECERVRWQCNKISRYIIIGCGCARAWRALPLVSSLLSISLLAIEQR